MNASLVKSNSMPCSGVYTAISFRVKSDDQLERDDKFQAHRQRFTIPGGLPKGGNQKKCGDEEPSLVLEVEQEGSSGNGDSEPEGGDSHGIRQIDRYHSEYGLRKQAILPYNSCEMDKNWHILGRKRRHHRREESNHIGD